MNTTAPLPPASAEPFAFALLQWPALVGVLALPDGGAAGWLRIALGLWLAATVLAAYSGRRGAGFGHTMLLLLGCVAGAWWSHPSAWSLAWLAPLLIGLHAAQRVRVAGGAGRGDRLVPAPPGAQAR